MNGVLRAQAERLVKNGAAYLDHEAAVRYPDIVPQRWYNVVDLNRLDMQVGTRNVLAWLGQDSRYNLLHYGAVAQALGMNPYPEAYDGAVIQCGFYAMPGEWEAEEYHHLTVAWKWLILRRRADDPAFACVSLAS